MNPILNSLKERPGTELVLETDDQLITAAELLQDVTELAAELERRGIDRLGLLASNSAAWVIADLACQLADVCLLPLPMFFSQQQITNSLNRAGVDSVLTDNPASLPDDNAFSHVDSSEIRGLEFIWLSRPAQRRDTLPANTNKVTFTSGSTGEPRGVCLSTAQQIQVAQSLQQVLQVERPRHLCLLPLSTLLENIGGIYSPLLANGAVIIPPETATGFSGTTGLDMPRMLQTLTQYQPTSIILLPQMLVGLVAALEAGWRAPAALQFAAIGGGKVAPELLRVARGFGFPAYEGYGLSEVASVAFINRPGDELIGSVGRPLPHLELRIDAGEIVINGNSFLGYADQPDTWQQADIRTGDLGKIDEHGFVHIQGRCKNLLISSLGRNISPEWVESAALRHPEIAECIVCGDDRPYCSALITAASPAITDEQIQATLDSVNTTLPDYARILRWHRLEENLAHNKLFFTANGRPKRTVIIKHFQPVLDSLYADSAETQLRTMTQ
jgi:long-chain acyl-CoA synthetase